VSTTRTPGHRWVWALVGALTWPVALVAQYGEPPPPAAYALTGVTVVQADGNRTENVTIVVRRGLIEAMGDGLTPPLDAQVLEGDSLWVYPGLVDAYGEADFEFPAIEVDRSQIRSWAPPRHLQGFMPHRAVVEHLTATGTSTKDHRTKGIVAAGVHPRGGLMPGRGTLLLFRKGATTPEELVLRAALGPAMSLRGGQGVYPGTLFGVVAFHRQSFADARRHGVMLTEYSRDPSGMTAPAWDPDFEILRDVVEGSTPVFFAADSAEDIRRALGLADELGFEPMIVGGADAWRVADRLATANVPVLVSVDFPEPTRWKPEKPSEPEDSAAAAEEVEAEPQEPEPLDAAALREKEHLENVWANAGRLAAAGVRLALTTGGGKGDLLEGARKAIEFGLSEPDALRAVTATPATLLGAAQLARVEPGMAATFIATDGPLFGEDTRIAYTFVEGEVEKGRARAGGPTEAPAVVLTGAWDVEVASDQGTINATMTIDQTGASFTGFISTEFGRMTIQDGTVSGNSVSFIGIMEMGGQSLEIEFSGTAQGDGASGSGSGPFGSLSWTATRKSGPGKETAQ
jgi:hypothetical protein